MQRGSKSRMGVQRESDGLSRMTFARNTAGSGNADVAFTFDSIGRTLKVCPDNRRSEKGS
jgi:hypothetical protein